MKKLGIIGGAGPLASSLFYETLAHEAYRLGMSMPETILVNYPFTRGLTRAEGELHGERIEHELIHCQALLEQAQAAMGIVICNTLHLYLNRIQTQSLPFLSIPSMLLQEIRHMGHQRLLLLGTQNTCKSTLYQADGLITVIPTVEEQGYVDRAIDHVLQGILLPEDAHQISALIQEYQNRVDAVILGCTDLPVLHHHYPLSTRLQIYDSVKLAATRTLGML